MTRATARALAYLVCGLFAGAAGLVWSLASTIAVALLAITQLGGPTLLGANWVTRRLADIERHRAGWVLGRPIGSPYVQRPAGTLRERVGGVVAQPATWRDLAWLVILFPVGLAGGIAAIVIAGVDLGAITAPAWAWAVPNPRAPFPMRPLMTTAAGRFGLTVIGLALAPLAAWLLRMLGRTQARAPRRCSAPVCTDGSWSRRPTSPRPANGWSTPRQPSCVASSVISTTGPRPGSSPPA